MKRVLCSDNMSRLHANLGTTAFNGGWVKMRILFLALCAPTFMKFGKTAWNQASQFPTLFSGCLSRVKFFPIIFATKSRSRRKTIKKIVFWRPIFSKGITSNFYGSLLAQFTSYRLAKLGWVPFADIRVRNRGQSSRMQNLQRMGKMMVLFAFVDRSSWNFWDSVGDSLQLVHNAVLRSSILCLVPKIFAVQVAVMLRSRRIMSKMGCIGGLRFLGEGIPQHLNMHFQIALTFEHVAGFGWVPFSELWV